MNYYIIITKNENMGATTLQINNKPTGENQTIEKVDNRPPAILKKIKDFTATHHHNIEQGALTKAIVEGTITKEDYLKLLCRFYGFYKACESTLENSSLWEKANFDINFRKKMPLLEKDLHFLGYSIADIPTCADVPTLNSDAQKLGYLYVAEGSTLGGQYLSRAIAKKLGFTAENGASYFNSYGSEHLGYMWKQFQQLLTDFANENPLEEAEIMESAATTFQKLDNWLA